MSRTTNRLISLIVIPCWLSGGMLACSSDDSTGAASSSSGSTSSGSSSSGSSADSPPTNTGTAELPATGTDVDVRAWLAKGDYKAGTWKCEPEPHPARSPSPHGMNRICSNMTLSAHGAGEFPVGSAAVKELYDDAGKEILGHAVYRKLTAGGGESFYWWEDMKGSVVANNLGDKGSAKTICVGCHAGAGSDAMHSGHDQVYTQVK